jgi:hypothetical protein
MPSARANERACFPGLRKLATFIRRFLLQKR